MTVLHKLASATGRRDETPNRELAAAIAATVNKDAVKELVENLKHKNKAVQSDCIKVIYEIGQLNPGLIADYAPVFMALLNHKNNRLQWGAMTALSSIAKIRSKYIYDNISQILRAAEKGSVITRDHAVNILITLACNTAYSETAFDLLIEQLLKSPPNQLPMYAEKALPVVGEQNKMRFLKALQSRRNDIEKESKRKRIERVLKKLST